MSGVECFVSSNFPEHVSTFNSCLNLIVYGYSLVERSQKYSRKEVKEIAANVRGKITHKIELEDFLRNDLVTKYIEPNRSLFGLEYYQFHSGVEEFSNNVKTGILDIKVCSPLFNGNTYFIFECKRLNKKIVDNYVKEGISRFVKEQYYPDSENSFAGMISFLESSEKKNVINISSSYEVISSVLSKYRQEINLTSNLKKYKLECKENKNVADYKYVFISSHKRIRNPLSLVLFHIILDYNHLITD